MLVNNHIVATPEKEKESERQYPLVVELLKSIVSTLEKQLAKKGAVINFLLNQKVQNEVDNTTFISRVSTSDIQHYKKTQQILILRIRIVRKKRESENCCDS